MHKKQQEEVSPSKDIKEVEKRRYLVGGNWKSNGSITFVRDISNEVLNKMKFDMKKVEVVIAPMIIHIPSAKAMLNNNLQVCA
jgi:triosephosphate isomerase